MFKLRKLVSLVLVTCVLFSIGRTTFATESNELKRSSTPTLSNVSEFLAGNPTTQTIVVSEQEMITRMLENEIITHENLNAQLETLSHQSESSLKKSGYNQNQIDIIKNYDNNQNAYDYIYNSQNSVRSTRATTLKFQYGLAGSNTRRNLTIAYDMTWSDCPFWTFTDSFGIGWVVADSMSKPLATKIDSSMARVDYYDVDDNYAYLYRDVRMNDFSNRVVIGNPIIGSAQGNYGKRIGGVTEISTQSGSYNIDTIQLFVSYGHTIISLDVNGDVTLNFTLTDSSVSFGASLDVTQNIMAEDKHTFKYNSQDVIVA